METQHLSKLEILIGIVSEFHISLPKLITQAEHLTTDSCWESKLPIQTGISHTIANAVSEISHGAVGT